MKRIYLLALLLSLSWNTGAIEVAGVKLADKVQSGKDILVLNGAGTRVMAGMFHVYAIALYLPEKQHSIPAVLDDKLSKRVTLDFMFDVTSVQLLDATHKLMTENLSTEELNKSEAGWKKFAAIFDTIKDIHKTDQLVVDYKAATGATVSLSGREIGQVPEPEFMRAFLMVWLGANPAQLDLKDKLMGSDAK